MYTISDKDWLKEFNYILLGPNPHQKFFRTEEDLNDFLENFDFSLEYAKELIVLARTEDNLWDEISVSIDYTVKVGFP